MKHLLFFAGHRSGGRAERFKKTENNSFKNLFGKKTMIFITFLTLLFGFTTNAWAGKIDNTNYGKIKGSFNGWSEWDLMRDGSSDHYYGTFYVPTSNDNYQIKYVLGKFVDGGSGWGNEYSFGGWWINKDDVFQGDFGINKDNDQVVNVEASSGFQKWQVDIWGEYSNQNAVKIVRTAVSSLSISTFNTSASSVESGKSITMQPSGAAGGSGSYTYSYTSSKGGDFDGNTFTAPYVTKPTETTITVTVGDANSQLSGLTKATKTTTVTIYPPSKMYLKHSGWGNSGDGNWSWKEATHVGEDANGDWIYEIAKASYAASGCNWNTKAEDTGAGWVADDNTIKVGSPKDGDNCKYSFNYRTKVITITRYMTLTFKNGDATVGDPIEVLYNQSTTAPSAPSKTGYDFQGWSKDGGTTKIAAGATISNVIADAIYEAQWTPKTYTITYKDGGISDFSGVHEAGYPTTHTYNTTTTLKSASKDGYTFGGWYISSTCSGTAISSLAATSYTQNITLYAQWKATVTVSAGAHGSVSTSSVEADAFNGTAITATPDAGYYFTGWTTSDGISVEEEKASTKVKATKAGTITANFAERWVLRGSKKTNDDVLGGMPGWNNETAMSVDNSGKASVTCTLDPNTDFKFKILDKKSGNNKGQTSTTTLPPMDQPDSQWTLNGGNDVYIASAGYGAYTFYVEVDGDNPKVYYSAPASYLITMDTKTFSNDAVSAGDGGTITAKTTEGGQDFEVSNDKYVRDGGTVVFTATPKTGYTFAGFYSNAECTSELQAASSGTTYTISDIQENKAVYAKFTENMTPVTLYIGGEGTVKVGDVTHKSGDVFNVGVYTTVTFTVTPGTNYKFNGWTTSTGADFTIENNVLRGNGAGRTDGQILNANFGELDKIYYYNISGQADNVYWHWTSGKVFVYFKVNWDNTLGVNPQGCDCREMHRIGETDIYWAYIETKFALNQGIAFSDENMSNYANFNGYHGVYRTDFNKDLNMYVPRASDSKNNTDYASNGYWMKYDPRASENVGYYLKRKDASSTPLGEFQAIADGSHISSVTVSVDSNTDQYFYIVSAGGENYGATDFNISNRSHTIEKGIQFKVTPNGVGDYTLKLTQGEGTLMSLEVVYPANDGDYRVIYNNGTKDHPSQAIQGGDLVSFFVDATAVSDAFRIQQFTNGAWTNKVTSIAIPSAITESGVYNFQLADDGSSLTYKGAYTGNYYIRTDVAGGGWHNYQGNEKNLMAKGYIFGYNNTYDYAYTNWAGPNTNVKYAVANDYSICLSDSLEQGDEVIGVDKQALGEDGANIRFMWNSKTNELKRDYIGGSNDDEKFLLIYGSDNAAAASKTKSKLYETADAASPVDSVKFQDDGNWIYSKEVYVEPGAFAALTAHFNNKTQFFHGEGNAETGAVTTYEQFVGGSGENRLKMKVIYNFKTNELVAGYIPDGGTISTTIDLNSDLLWIRTQQREAMPINFSSTEISIKNINKIYGVLELCKDSMTNLYVGDVYQPLTTSSYDRINYWISFPFDVKVSDIFGVDGYGEKWVIQYYNGEKRAEIGWFAETSSFWEWLTLDSTMHAGKGYTLNLNTTYFDEATDDVWKNVESKVAFYFPSTETKIGVIKQQEVTTKIPDHAYQYDRPFDNNEKNHNVTDSYWNIIGTPAFQPTTISTASSGKQGPKAIYVWKQGEEGSNGYNIKETMTGFTFQPMRSYIVQYGGNVTWNMVSSIVKAAPYAYADQKNYLVDLEFYFGEQRDHTYINLSDEATKDFKLNEDVMKMTNSGAPNIYSYAEGYDVAYNEVPMANQTINLGVIARKNGSYTFAMPKDFSGSAILVDLEEGTATDLNVSNYSVDLNKGTYNNRFQLMLKVEASTPTNIDNVDGAPDGLEWNADGKTKKLLINDQIYLINGGRVYNVLGVEE